MIWRSVISIHSSTQIFFHGHVQKQELAQTGTNKNWGIDHFPESRVSTHSTLIVMTEKKSHLTEDRCIFNLVCIDINGKGISTMAHEETFLVPDGSLTGFVDVTKNQNKNLFTNMLKDLWWKMRGKQLGKQKWPLNHALKKLYREPKLSV